MPSTKRYLIGHRYGPKLDSKSVEALEALVKEGKEARHVRTTGVGRRVVEITPQQMREFADNNPQLIIEEDQPLRLSGMPGLPVRVPAEGKHTISVSLKDSTNGQPISGASVYALGTGVAYSSVTDANGHASVATTEKSISDLVISPQDTYWSRVVTDAASEHHRSPLEVTLKPLMTNGAFDWGVRLMNFRQVHSYWTGKDIKIAVVDSGVHSKEVKVAGGYNTLDGEDTKKWNVDEEGHGTHCAGIVAGHISAIGAKGAAPEAQIFSVKVMPGGFVSDLVEAIEWCIKEQVDVISLSLSVTDASAVLEGVIRDAYDRGITCIAAVGNDASYVSYPAAFPTVIAVGAIGRFGTFPEDSAHQLRIGRYRDYRGGLFSANFSNFGPEVQVCAPGVAILSTVPTGHAAWDGTSLACPLISGLSALIVQAYPSIRTGDPQQVEAVRSILMKSAVDLGLPPQIQGSGLPLAPNALISALTS
jgi:hypothetical protein